MEPFCLNWTANEHVRDTLKVFKSLQSMAAMLHTMSVFLKIFIFSRKLISLWLHPMIRTILILNQIWLCIVLSRHHHSPILFATIWRHQTPGFLANSLPSPVKWIRNVPNSHYHFASQSLIFLFVVGGHFCISGKFVTAAHQPIFILCLLVWR